MNGSVRQGQHKSRAAALAVLRADPAPMCFDDTFRDGEAHAGAFGFTAPAAAPVELVEDPFEFVGSDAGAAVEYLDDVEAVLGARLDLNG